MERISRILILVSGMALFGCLPHYNGKQANLVEKDTDSSSLTDTNQNDLGSKLNDEEKNYSSIKSLATKYQSSTFSTTGESIVLLVERNAPYTENSYSEVRIIEKSSSGEILLERLETVKFSGNEQFATIEYRSKQNNADQISFKEANVTSSVSLNPFIIITRDTSYKNKDEDQYIGKTRNFNFSGENLTRIEHENDFELASGSLEFHFRPLKYGGTLFSKDCTDVSGGAYISIYYLTDGKVSLWVRPPNENPVYHNTAKSYALKSVHHLKLDFSRSTGLKFYINDELLFENPLKVGLDLGNIEDIILGASNAQSTKGVYDQIANFYEGQIYNLKLYGSKEVPKADPVPEVKKELAQLSLSALKALVKEGDDQEVVFEVSANKAFEESTQVNFTLSGNAIMGQDYNASQANVLFNTGELKKTISFALIDDKLVEETESLIVTLMQSDKYSLSVNKEISFSFLDNDVAPSVPVPKDEPKQDGNGELDGVDDFIHIPYAADHKLEQGKLSFKFIARTLGGALFSRDNNDSSLGHGFLSLFVDNQGRISAWFRDNSAKKTDFFVTDNAVVEVDKEHLLELKFNKNTIYLAIDGKEAKSKTVDFRVDFSGNDQDIVLGAANIGIPGGELNLRSFFKGKISDFTLVADNSLPEVTPKPADPPAPAPTPVPKEEEKALVGFRLVSIKSNYREGQDQNLSFEIHADKAVEDDIEVDFELSGSAQNGSDYLLPNTTVAFNKGETRKLVSFMLNDDNSVENTESVIIKLIDGAGYKVLDQDEITLTIMDNDEAPSAPTPVIGDKIDLPVLVIGDNGTTRNLGFKLSSNQLSRAQKLYLRVHSLKRQNKASVRLNGGNWVTLNNSNVELPRYTKAYGGMGSGGFITIDLWKGISDFGSLKSDNVISFRFNQGNGSKSIGYRVIKFNITDGNNNNLISDSSFNYDDPKNWEAPEGYNNEQQMKAGWDLWKNAELINPITKAKIKARCGNCHAHDGRDLAYFNYENHTIVERSKFHGLSEDEGKKIAAFIRGINRPVFRSAPYNIKPVVYAPMGRPWNPPYQPGPGLDAKGADQWAAGAGLDAVLNNYDEMLQYIFPSAADGNGGVIASKISSYDIRPESDNPVFNTRELPLPVQLLDWNEWLPANHPMDTAGGNYFINHTYYRGYNNLRKQAKVGDPGSINGFAWGEFSGGGYGAVKYKLEKWDSDPVKYKNKTDFPRDRQRYTYDAMLWGMVKSWEIMTEFQLEDNPQKYWAKKGSRHIEKRSWYHQLAFDTSPNLVGISRDEGHILFDGSKKTWRAIADSWYHIQYILHPGNGHQADIRPMDWNHDYFIGPVKQHYSMYDGVARANILNFYFIAKNAQDQWKAGLNDSGYASWHYYKHRPMNFFMESRNRFKSNPGILTADVMQAMMNAYLEHYVTKLNSFGNNGSGGFSASTFRDNIMNRSFYKSFKSSDNFSGLGRFQFQQHPHISIRADRILAEEYGVDQKYLRELSKFGEALYPRAQYGVDWNNP